VVTMWFRPPDGSDPAGSELRLGLVLTRRSGNALLVGGSGVVEGAVKEAGPLQIGKSPPAPRPPPSDPPSPPPPPARGLSSEEILETYFGSSSPFGKLYLQEFMARSRSVTPSLAFRSIVEDLITGPWKPIMYSSVPLGPEIAVRAMDGGPPWNSTPHGDS